MTKIRSGIISVFIVAALGATTDSLSQANSVDLGACAAEKDDAARLECFDNATKNTAPAAEVESARETDSTAVIEPAEQVDESPVAAPAAAAGAATAPAATTAPDSAAAAGNESLDEFGMNADIPGQNPDEELREVKAKAVEVSQRVNGEHVVTLDNGQVWTEKIAEYGFRVKVGDTVTIKKGKLGGYRMVGRGRRSSDVKRVK